MVEQSAPWEGKEQPPNNQLTDFSVRTSIYKIYHKGLRALLEELKKFDQIAKELEIETSPYENEIVTIKGLVEWGDKQLNFDSPQLMTSPQEAPYNILRYLKAGVLLLVYKSIEKRLNFLNDEKYSGLPRRLLQAHDEKLKQLKELVEQGKMGGLRPAEVFFDITSPVKEEYSYEIY